MHRGPARPSVRRRHQRSIEQLERQPMTAPLKHSDSVTVDVALGDRTYDIVIGRDVLPSLAARLPPLRPGAPTPIATDPMAANHCPGKAEPSPPHAALATPPPLS